MCCYCPVVNHLIFFRSAFRIRIGEYRNHQLGTSNDEPDPKSWEKYLLRFISFLICSCYEEKENRRYRVPVSRETVLLGRTFVANTCTEIQPGVAIRDEFSGGDRTPRIRRAGRSRGGCGWMSGSRHPTGTSARSQKKELILQSIWTYYKVILSFISLQWNRKRNT